MTVAGIVGPGFVGNAVHGIGVTEQARARRAMKWSEAAIQRALATCLDCWQHLCVPNVQQGSEQGFVVLSRSGLLWEIEIKISRADWRADMAKRRHYMAGWEPARFYYAVPESLVPGRAIPEWVPSHAGVLALYGSADRPQRLSCSIVRQARPLHRNKAPAGAREELLRKVYFRYWRHVAPELADTQDPTLEIGQ